MREGRRGKSEGGREDEQKEGGREEKGGEAINQGELYTT